MVRALETFERWAGFVNDWQYETRHQQRYEMASSFAGILIKSGIVSKKPGDANAPRGSAACEGLKQILDVLAGDRNLLAIFRRTIDGVVVNCSEALTSYDVKQKIVHFYRLKHRVSWTIESARWHTAAIVGGAIFDCSTPDDLADYEFWHKFARLVSVPSAKDEAASLFADALLGYRRRLGRVAVNAKHPYGKERIDWIWRRLASYDAD